MGFLNSFPWQAVVSPPKVIMRSVVRDKQDNCLLLPLSGWCPAGGDTVDIHLPIESEGKLETCCGRTWDTCDFKAVWLEYVFANPYIHLVIPGLKPSSTHSTSQHHFLSMVVWFQSDNSSLPSQHKSLSLVSSMNLPPCSEAQPKRTFLHKPLALISQIIMLAYFNRHGAQVRGGGGKGEREVGEGRNEKHKEVSERDISFFHTMCYCKIFISSAIPLPPSSPLFFFSITVSVHWLR